MSEKWKGHVRRLQQNSCIICTEEVADGEGSWDHFVPQAVSSKFGFDLRLGLGFWAHKSCNSRRGHTKPNPAMMRRAASVIANLEPHMRKAAMDNLGIALREHRSFVAILETLIVDTTAAS